LPKTLPPLGPRGGSSSGPSISNAHTHASITVRPRKSSFQTIPTLPIFQPGPVGSQIRSLADSQASGLPWGTEADICRYVCTVLNDLLIVLHLPLEIKQELSVLPLRPDIWVVEKMGLPVGVVEVKTPSRSLDPLESPSVAGQIYDYMMKLRSFYGLQAIFGIITTYAEWRICWLHTTESHKLACLTTEEYTTEGAPVASLCDLLNGETVDESISDPADEQEALTPSLKRSIFATEKIQWDDESLLPMLASAVWKMMKAPRKPINLVDFENRPYIKISEHGWVWTKLNPRLFSKKLKINQFPSPTAKSFILLYDFGRSTEGRVYLAVTTSGATCVIKFSLDEKNCAVLTRESESWRMIWGLRTRIIRLAESTALIMPFARPLSDQQWNQTDIQQKVKTAVKTMVQKGMKHGDLHRRHVGLYRDKAVFFDLSTVTAITGRNERAAKAEMLQKLGLS